MKVTMDFTEIVRWSVISGMEVIRGSDDRVVHQDLARGIMIEMCCTYDWEEHPHRFVEFAVMEAARKVHGGALSISTLLRIHENTVVPPGSIAVPDRYEAWAKENVSTLEATNEEQRNDVARWMMLSFLLWNVDDWYSKLTRLDNLNELFRDLSHAAATGIALYQHIVPPWLDDDPHVRCIRAVWEGKEAYEAWYQEAAIGSTGLAVEDLTPARVSILEDLLKATGKTPVEMSALDVGALIEKAKAHPGWFQS